MALARMVPSDWVSINEISPDPERVYAVVRPEMSERQHVTFARLALENPLIVRFNRTADTRPYRFSDIVSVKEYHALALYREFYAEIGLEHQIAFVVKVSTDSHVGIALSRRRRDFSDAERDLLDRARPFLIQIYRNALAFAAATAHAGPDDPMIERLLGRGLTRREAAVLSAVAHGAARTPMSRARSGSASGPSESTCSTATAKLGTSPTARRRPPRLRGRLRAGDPRRRRCGAPRRSAGAARSSAGGRERAGAPDARAAAHRPVRSARRRRVARATTSPAVGAGKVRAARPRGRSRSAILESVSASSSALSAERGRADHAGPCRAAAGGIDRVLGEACLAGAPRRARPGRRLRPPPANTCNGMAALAGQRGGGRRARRDAPRPRVRRRPAHPRSRRPSGRGRTAHSPPCRR